MRTASECTSEAARLRVDAGNARNLETRDHLLAMADQWAKLAITANWQDRWAIGKG